MRNILGLIIVALTCMFIPPSLNGQEKQAEKRMKPALLVIDIQNQYLNWMASDNKDMAMYLINASIELFREKGFPIIRVYNTDPQRGPQPGTEAFEFPSTVSIKPDDPKVIKNYPNAFNKTNLEQLLKDQGSNTLFLCGLSATGCVLATYFGAIDRDYGVFMIKDALLSPNAGYTNAVEDVVDAVGYEAVKAMLENASK
jgi:nicotinamidase-related amidase